MKLKPVQLSISLIVISCFVINFTFRKWDKTERVIENDIHYYYGYLPAQFIYNDIKLDKSDYRYGENLYWFWSVKTPEGKKVFKMTMGLAYLYSPFFFVAHIYSLNSDYPADGFSEPYKFFLLLSTIFFLIIGLNYVSKILLKLGFSNNIAAIVIFITVLGTNLLAYSTNMAPMPHAYNFCLFAIFIFYSIKWQENILSKKTVIILGVLIGLISLIRPTNAVILIFPLLLNYQFIFTKNILKYVLIYIIPFAILPWIPQVIYWKFTTGNFIYYTYNEEGFNFLEPQIWNGLFSFRKGWLIYTPLMIFALMGIYFLRVRLKIFILPVTTFVVINIYLIFSWWCWWYGGSIGQRPMIESYALLSIPLAALVEQFVSKNKFVKYISILIAAFLIWLNVFQIFQYQRSSLHWDSMSRQLFFEQFGKSYPIEGYHSLLDPPVYKYSDQNAQVTDNKEESFYILAPNGKYLSIKKDKGSIVIADAANPSINEKIIFVNLEDDAFGFMTDDKKYFAHEHDKNNELTATRTSIGAWEQFKIEYKENDKFAIKASNNKYLSVDPSTNQIKAVSDKVGNLELFSKIKN